MVSPRVVLIGPPGAGKTTVGQLLATRWDLPFVDTDEVVSRDRGQSISDIFVAEGEAAFRRYEEAAVRSSLNGPGVVALGGGAAVQPWAAAALADLPVVFLDVTIADASGRIGFDTSRPLLAVNPRASWTRMMNERRPAYETVARWRVDTAGRTPEQVADAIEALA
ncbi:shikimate kinase [Calidifontibacter sp. DB0510]|uniref:Shikimate kinase n=1 Tax=Metallococcus carri TaxID=1656884 RepID=A0A967AXW7_9MICO|nr:shikimate kinase [Metallococcus carri]NHN55026.1 shikimate kinase [Metallococcus carri]NOP37372.1 shikimate kinase [Calidifontibacter sp. DB2511S]